MRRDRYDLNNSWEGVLSWLMSAMFFIGWLIWTPIRLVFAGLGKLAADVARGVYGKAVQALSAIAFLAIASFIVSLVRK